MLSVVVHATLDEVDPPTLSELELYAFFFLLFSAGSETTRNAIAGGLLALLERPDQLDAAQGRIPSCSPPRRGDAALDDTVAGASGAPRRAARSRGTIEPGDKVLVWEGSANRDEQVFDRPAEFDIRRDPNPHLTFGHGVHHCLGASLARLEIRVLFAELLPRFGGCELLQPAEWTRSNRHMGLRHLHVAFTST